MMIPDRLTTSNVRFLRFFSVENASPLCVSCCLGKWWVQNVFSVFRCYDCGRATLQPFRIVIIFIINEPPSSYFCLCMAWTLQSWGMQMWKSKTTWAHGFFPKQWAQRSTYRVYAPDLPPKMAVKNGPSQSFWVYIQSKTDPWSTRHPNTFLNPKKYT